MGGLPPARHRHAIDYDDHHRHSHYLILNAGLPGYDPREVKLIGLIAR